ncbi:MAG: DUF72 domain-containing protein, partial [Verrucomicrobiota bacterium]
DELALFCREWPTEFPLAVEVRHPSFFASGNDEADLNDYLRSRGYDRVIFDSRALYHKSPDDEVEAASQTRKPNLPVRWIHSSQSPFLRLVGRNKIELTDPWLEEAADAAAQWIQKGMKPFLFMHAPDDQFAPYLCERFYQRLSQRIQLPPLDLSLARGDQMELF